MPQELQTLGHHTSSRDSIIHHSDHINICLSGVGAKNATQAADLLLKHGAKILISWGTAAALKPGIEPGEIYIPEEIVCADGQIIETTPVLRTKIVEKLSNEQVIFGSLCEASSLLSDRNSKRALATHTGANVADMESAAIGRVAKKHNISFLVIRSVSDSDDMSVPPAVSNNLINGTTNVPGIVKDTLFRPQDWISLINLFLNFRKAKKSLRNVARAVLPDLSSYVDNVKFFNHSETL